jgi:mitogen-activated protein kinase kinase
VKKTKKKSRVDKDGHELVKDEDLEILNDIGAGNGGTVTKVYNKKRKCIMARKVCEAADGILSFASYTRPGLMRKLILVDAKPSVRKQILRELQIMSDCRSPYIIEYYGCFPVDVHVGLVIEYMDAGQVSLFPRVHVKLTTQIP